MSMIVGVCGTNFCTFISDGRLVAFQGTKRSSVLSDDFRKIMKVNPRVILGVTGFLAQESKIDDALSALPDPEHASVKIVRNAVCSHIKMHTDTLPPCNYLIGGKQNDGSFLIYELQFSADTRKITEVIRRPTPQQNFAISLALPMGTGNQAQMLHDIGQLVTGVRTHEEMVRYVGGVIQVVADHDSTVGKTIFSESVF